MMSNISDIHIQQDYWNQGDSFDDMLTKKQEFLNAVKFHLDYFESISTKEKYQEAYNELYGEEVNDG
jgi:hypothetical protein